MKAHPPRWATALIDRALPPDAWGDGIRGDLHQEFVERTRTGGVVAARLWFAAQAVSILFWSFVDARRGRRWGDMNASTSGSNHRFVWLNSLRTAVRGLRRAPGYSVAVIATLGLSLTVATLVFAVVRGVLLAPLPYPEPDRLVRFDRIASDGSLHNGAVAYLDLLDWQAELSTVEHIAGTTGAELTFSDGDTAEIWEGLAVTSGFLDALGVRPALGVGPAGFAAGTQPGAGRILLSHRIWQQRFGGDPNILGRVVRLSGADWTVDAVLPAGFTYDVPAIDFLTPLPDSRFLQTRASGFLRTVGRLSDGVTLDTARAEVDRVVPVLDAQYDEWQHGVSLRLVHDALVGPVRRPLMTFMGAVALILLTACANVAAVTLSRTESRRAELALRQSLGASRERIFGQLMVESLLLSLTGGLVGFVGVWIGLQWALGLVTSDLPRSDFIVTSLPDAMFAALAAMAAGLASGLLPALRGSRVRCDAMLRSAPNIAGRGRRGQEILACAQIAVAVVLVFAAGVLGRSLLTLTAVDPGFRTDNLLVVEVGLEASTYGDRDRILGFHRELLHSVGALDGVESTALSSHLPFSPSRLSATVVREGQIYSRNTGDQLNLEFVNGDYLETMGLTLKEGRGFDLSDDPAPRQILINEAAAARLWPGQNPVGQRLSFDVEEGESGAAGSYFEVAGVVNGTLRGSLSETREPIGYYLFPDISRYYTFISGRAFYLVVHTDGRDPLALAEPVRRALGAIDPTVPPRTVATMAQLIDETTRTERFVAAVVSIFGGLTLAVALIGLYGVIAHGVSQTRREIGVRIALGESRASVRARVLLRAARVVVIAGTIGGGAALAAASLLEAFLFEVPPRDLATLGSVLLAVIAGALLAALAPAYAASRVDPIEALRG